MCPPLSPFHCYIEINITDNRHFALVYLLGITRLTFTRSMAREPSIHPLRSWGLCHSYPSSSDGARAKQHEW